jgi:hypothetical protein
MCNCTKRAAATRGTLVVQQAPAQPLPPIVRGRPLRPEPLIHDPAIWGPHLWTALHTLAEFLPVHNSETRRKWSGLLDALRKSIPCPDCTHHYIRWYSTHRIIYGYGVGAHRQIVDIKAWILDLHNDVNLRKGVPTWDAAAVTATYGGDRAARAHAVRMAINAVRGMIGFPALRALDGMVRDM